MTEHKITDNIEYKKCNRCGKFKLLIEFQRRQDSKDGYRDQCISCLAEIREKRAKKPLNIASKICSKCKKELDISEFTIDRNSPDGYNYVCKSCSLAYRQKNAKRIRQYSLMYSKKPEIKEYMKNYNKRYRLDNPEKVKQHNKNRLEHYYKNRDKILDEQRKKYYEQNKEQIEKAKLIKEQKEKERQNKLIERQNKEKETIKLFSQGLKRCNDCKQIKPLSEFYIRKSCSDGYSGQCKKCIAEKDKQYKASLTEEQKQQRKEYIRKYTEEHKERNREYQKAYRNDPENKLKLQMAEKLRHKNNRLGRNFSKLIYQALKENKAERHWEDLVPYSLVELKEHLEKQFDQFMNWENYGEYWEVDHIVPQNQFHFEKPEDKEFQICWSLMNLRPLEKSANRKRPKDGSDISNDIKYNILSQR